VTGHDDVTTPMLMKAWMTISSAHPTMTKNPKRSVVRWASMNARIAKAAKSISTIIVPSMPSSSPITAKMKSVCASGR
jgi:hypothetical protein